MRTVVRDSSMSVHSSKQMMFFICFFICSGLMRAAIKLLRTSARMAIKQAIVFK
jgi:hypothetical protein